MGEHLTQTDIIINIVVQVINIAIFFFLFIKFAGKPISSMIEKRIAQQKKLENADAEYEKLIADATKRKENLMAEALAHKTQLVEEWKSLATQEKEKILDKAQREAALILEKAQQEADLKDRDLEANFEQGVRVASLAALKKLFANNSSVTASYLDTLVDEFNSSYKS